LSLKRCIVVFSAISDSDAEKTVPEGPLKTESETPLFGNFGNWMHLYRPTLWAVKCVTFIVRTMDNFNKY